MATVKWRIADTTSMQFIVYIFNWLPITYTLTSHPGINDDTVLSWLDFHSTELSTTLGLF